MTRNKGIRTWVKVCFHLSVWSSSRLRWLCTSSLSDWSLSKSSQSRGGSRGRVQGVRTPPSPRWSFLLCIHLKICLPHRSVTSFLRGTPPPKKNPGSALAKLFRFAVKCQCAPIYIYCRRQVNLRLYALVREFCWVKAVISVVMFLTHAQILVRVFLFTFERLVKAAWIASVSFIMNLS